MNDLIFERMYGLMNSLKTFFVFVLTLCLMSCDGSSTINNSGIVETEIPEEPEHPEEPDDPEEPDESDDLVEMEECNCLMDTLYGEWKWIGNWGAWSRLGEDLPYKSYVKFGQKKDFSFYYEVFADDTLFHKDSFQYRYGPDFLYLVNHWFRIVVINLPHNFFRLYPDDYPKDDWSLYWFHDGGIHDDQLSLEFKPDTLAFWAGELDAYYIYERIRKE